MKTENYILKMKIPSIRNKRKPIYFAVLLVAFFSSCGLDREPEYVSLRSEFTIIDRITRERILGACGKFAYCPDTIKAYNKAGDKFDKKTIYKKVYENNIVIDSIPTILFYWIDLSNEQFFEKYGKEYADTAFLYLDYTDCDTIVFSVSMQDIEQPATEELFYNGIRLKSSYYQIKKQKR